MSVATLLWPIGSRHQENLRAIPSQLPLIGVDTQTFVMNRPRFGFGCCAATVLRAFDEG